VSVVVRMYVCVVRSEIESLRSGSSLIDACGPFSGDDFAVHFEGAPSARAATSNRRSETQPQMTKGPRVCGASKEGVSIVLMTFASNKH